MESRPVPRKALSLSLSLGIGACAILLLLAFFRSVPVSSAQRVGPKPASKPYHSQVEPPSWGSILVPSTTWEGVNVYSNFPTPREQPTSVTGIEWECVELVQRFYSETMGYHRRDYETEGYYITPTHAQWSGVMSASQMFDYPLPGIITVANGGLPPPQWGDVIVFAGGSYGHVAIVTSVEVSTSAQAITSPAGSLTGTVRFVEQNIRGNGQGSLSIISHTYGITIEDRPGYPVRGWLHSPRNRREYTVIRRFPNLVLTPGSEVTVSCVVQNEGVPWFPGKRYRLVNVNDTPLGAPPQRLETFITRGQTMVWSLPLVAPMEEGIYTSAWRVFHGDTPIGPEVCLEVAVTSNPAMIMLILEDILEHMVDGPLEGLEDLRQWLQQLREKYERFRRFVQWLEQRWNDFKQWLRGVGQFLADLRQKSQQCCGIPPAASLLGALGFVRIRRRRKKETSTDERDP